MIVLDGIPAEQLGMHVLKDYVDPSIPATRDLGVVIPGRHGEIDFGAFLGKREFNFPIVLIPQDSYYEALKKTDELKKILLDKYGRPRTFKLIVGDRPDRYYEARYSGALPINDLIKNRFFTLPLVAHDPMAYSIVKSTDKLTWGSKIPFATPIKISYKPSQYDVFEPTSLNVNTIGSLVVRPVIEIFGRAKSLTLRINGALFTFGDLTNGIVMIDAENYTVLKNGQNYLPEMKGNVEMIELNPGDNEVEIGGIDLAVQLTLNFRGKYK